MAVLAEQMKNIVETIISSYEGRLQNIESIFTHTHLLIDDFQSSFIDKKQEREKLNSALRECLARNESLRKKDFDNMTQDIFAVQDKREEEIKELLRNYLSEQRQWVSEVRKNLVNVKDTLAQGEARRVQESQTLIRDIADRQEQRKKEVAAKLAEFQQEQRDWAVKLQELLTKGKDLRIKDLQAMLKEFRLQHNARKTFREERKKKIREQLSGFRKEREETAEKRRTMQQEKAQRRQSGPALK